MAEVLRDPWAHPPPRSIDGGPATREEPVGDVGFDPFTGFYRVPAGGGPPATTERAVANPTGWDPATGTHPEGHDPEQRRLADRVAHLEDLLRRSLAGDRDGNDVA